jgi:hypothetical protein
MFNRILSPVLVGLLINLVAVHSAYATPVQGPDVRAAERVREKVSNLGRGPEARAEVRLKDGTKLRGYISEASDDHFTVVDAAGRSTQVDYSQVKSVKDNRHRFFDAKGAAVGGGLIAGIFLIAIFYVKQTK